MSFCQIFCEIFFTLLKLKKMINGSIVKHPTHLKSSPYNFLKKLTKINFF